METVDDEELATLAGIAAGDIGDVFALGVHRLNNPNYAERLAESASSLGDLVVALAARPPRMYGTWDRTYEILAAGALIREGNPFTRTDHALLPIESYFLLIATPTEPEGRLLRRYDRWIRHSLEKTPSDPRMVEHAAARIMIRLGLGDDYPDRP